MRLVRFPLGLIIAVTLVLLAGCSLFGDRQEAPYSQVPPPVDFSRFSQHPPLLTGRWGWQRSTVYGPGTPGTSTPSTTGRTETLVFPCPPDSVRVYRNDTLYQHVSRATFFEDAITWGVHDDTLATSRAALDGPQIIYKQVE